MAHKLVPGALVVTADGRDLGRVKEVKEDAFLVDAAMQFDYWLDVSLVKEADLRRVELTLDAGDLGAYERLKGSVADAIRPLTS